MLYLWVAIGGALGSVARFACSNFAARHLDHGFPWGTMIINLAGSFAIGAFAATTTSGGKWIMPVSFSHFFMVGVCGGYTTFSAFSLQTLTLMEKGDWGRALANATGSVAGCIAAVWLGHTLGSYLNSTKEP